MDVHASSASADAPDSHSGPARFNRRRFLLRAATAGLALPALAGLVGACGGSTASPTAAAAAAATTPTVAATPSTSDSRSAAAAAARAAIANEPTVTLNQTAGSYKLQLRIGPPVRIYTQAQVTQNHPTSGEELLSGQMPGFNGTPGAGRFRGTPPAGGFRGPRATPGTRPGAGAFIASRRSLALYVNDAATSAPVTTAKVTITVVDNTGHGPSINVPVDTLQAVDAGASDFHYGNEVFMPPNRDYTVNVTVNGTAASFNVHITGG